MPRPMNDLTNQRFGNLIAINVYSHEGSGHHIKWLCQCDCGKKTIVESSKLTSRNVKSCGCTHNDCNASDGLWKTPLYHVWRTMKYRCYNTNNKKYINYGGRGITVCDEWKDDFKAFYTWAISTGWSKGLTLDRINVNGNYEPSNCQWLTVSENSKKRWDIDRFVKDVA